MPAKQPPVYATCQICNARFQIKPYEKETRRYCSKKCFYSSQSVNKIQCPTCGKIFTPRIKGETRQTHCSIACRWEDERKRSKNKTIFCERCGKPFVIYPSRLVHGNPRYCSQECAGNKRRSENLRFTRLKTKEWAEIRDGVIARDKGMCRICHTDKQLVVHHVTPWVKTRNDSPSNLITLCRPCHHKVEWSGFPCPVP